uniref:Uncharacterized protein n=1 Tax=Tetraselmis sp. GSL018 TaxID=582737 RepID=A0A061R4L0_9CHLO
MALAEDILYGAISGGVNKSTAILLNGIFLALFGSILALLIHCWSKASSVVPHLFVLLALFVGLACGTNWLISSVGLAEVAEQRRELFPEERSRDSADSPKKDN